jgi:hypothetical protein
VAFLKQQLKELLDQYSPEVLWFDGEWPDWWTEPDGRDLYAFLRSVKPTLIVNNRVGKATGLEACDLDPRLPTWAPRSALSDSLTPLTAQP